MKKAPAQGLACANALLVLLLCTLQKSFTGIFHWNKGVTFKKGQKDQERCAMPSPLGKAFLDPPSVL